MTGMTGRAPTGCAGVADVVLHVALLVAPSDPAEVVVEEVWLSSVKNPLVSSRSLPMTLETAMEVLS
jgi:hypothetical protein